MSSEDEAHEMVDATGTRRRLQALLANGHRAKDLVAALGVHTSCQRIIRSEKVSAVIRDSVTQLYGELENRVGPSDLARERYRGLGYLSPMWWDPDIIDDPDAEPAGIRVYMKIRVEDAQGVIRYRTSVGGRRHRNTSGTCRPYAPTGPLGRSDRCSYRDSGPLREARFG